MNAVSESQTKPNESNRATTELRALSMLSAQANASRRMAATHMNAVRSMLSPRVLRREAVHA